MVDGDTDGDTNTSITDHGDTETLGLTDGDTGM